MTDRHIFRSDEAATEYLRSRDPKLGEHIDRIGEIRREVTPDIFEALTESIISQQISGKAAVTICSRLRELLREITPEAVLDAEHEKMKACGISARKISYIKSAAEAVTEGTLPVSELDGMNDEDIIAVLDALPGIGRWTAEMLLIFSLQRANILSYDDLGIRKGLMRLHGLDSISRGEFEYYRELYSPYCSTASFYLWHLTSEREVLK